MMNQFEIIIQKSVANHMNLKLESSVSSLLLGEIQYIYSAIIETVYQCIKV